MKKLEKRRSFGPFSIKVKKHKNLTPRCLSFYNSAIEKSLKIPLFFDFATPSKEFKREERYYDQFDH